jgi:hypothetical protein
VPPVENIAESAGYVKSVTSHTLVGDPLRLADKLEGSGAASMGAQVPSPGPTSSGPGGKSPTGACNQLRAGGTRGGAREGSPRQSRILRMASGRVNGGHDAQAAAAMGAFQNVHGENPVHQLRPRIVAGAGLPWASEETCLGRGVDCSAFTGQ